MGPTARTIDFLARLMEVPDGPASLPWKADGDNAFLLTGQSGAIRVSNEGNGEHPYALRVYGPYGTVIEEAVTVPDEFYHSWERQLEALYMDARTAALNLPEVLAGLTEEFGLPTQLPPTTVSPSDDDIPF